MGSILKREKGKERGKRKREKKRKKGKEKREKERKGKRRKGRKREREKGKGRKGRKREREGEEGGGEIPYRLSFWRGLCWVLQVRVASGVDTEFPYRVRIVARG